MPRPPLPVGTAGKFRVYQTPTGYRATCLYRDYDGMTRPIERHDVTENRAINRLREAIRDRTETDHAGEIRPDSKVSVLGEKWFEEIEALVEAGKRSPGTAQHYRGLLDRIVIPAIGSLRIREVTVSRVDRMCKAITDQHGASTAKTCRSIASGMFRLAARHDAIRSNPVRDIGTISVNSKVARALTLEEVWDLRGKLALDAKSIGWDLPDFVDMMLASGLRIGETAAVTWPAVDLDKGTVEVRGTVIRIKGKGLVIKWRPKSKSGWRTLELPGWAVAMLRRRRDEMADNEWQAVFPSPLGMLRDPSNTQADLRDRFDTFGYPGISSHTFRKTVATLMDDNGLSARAAADQLGHAKVSMTQDHYFGRRVVVTGAARVLEELNGRPASDTEN